MLISQKEADGALIRLQPKGMQAIFRTVCTEIRRKPGIVDAVLRAGRNRSLLRKQGNQCFNDLSHYQECNWRGGEGRGCHSDINCVLLI